MELEMIMNLTIRTRKWNYFVVCSNALMVVPKGSILFDNTDQGSSNFGYQVYKIGNVRLRALY